MRHPTKLRKRNLWRRIVRTPHRKELALWRPALHQVPAVYFTRELTFQRVLKIVYGPVV